jgi:hypothetical protein
MSGDPQTGSAGKQDDEPAVPPEPSAYPTIGTVNVERGANPDADSMVQDDDMSGESGPDSDR